MLPRPLRLAIPLLLVAAATLSAGCRSRGSGGRSTSPGAEPMDQPGPMSLNRGDWLMGSQDKIWLVLAESPTGGAPTHLGYVTSRRYREVRGGPEFTMYEVTTKDRHDVIGMVDSLGNATRFRYRYGHTDHERAGNNTLPMDVQAIFETVRPITLRETTERELAFEALDANHDGVLDKTEFPRLNDRVGNPDRNGDGKVDRQEFGNTDL